MYQLCNDFAGNLISIIKLQDNLPNLGIPLDPANTDYQAYLAWLAEGNEPLPADEPQQEALI
jgi:hypothetical protein